MSHPQNDIYLENMQERYDAAENDAEREKVIAELRENGFDTQADQMLGQASLEL